MKILVTGARGMVGRNACEVLAQAGHSLLTPGRDDLNLSAKAQVEEYVAAHRPDLVIHAAGKVGGIQANMAQPVEFLVENLDMGRNVIMAAKQAGVPRLLNLASSCMYPAAAESPLPESLVLAGALEPTNEGYALAKIVATRLCSYISASSDALSYKTVIPCNLYGRHDKFDPSHSHLVPAIIHKVHQAKINQEATVEIWGDGTARREFMFSGDVADGILRAVEQFDSLPEVMNLGLGHDYTVNEYYQAVAKVVDWHGEFTHDLSKPVGMKRKMVDVTRQTQWGWQPSYSLEQGLEQTYEFYLENYAQ